MLAMLRTSALFNTICESSMAKSFLSVLMDVSSARATGAATYSLRHAPGARFVVRSSAGAGCSAREAAAALARFVDALIVAALFERFLLGMRGSDLEHLHSIEEPVRV